MMTPRNDPPELDEGTRIFLEGVRIGVVIGSALCEAWWWIRSLVRGRHGN